MLHKIKQAGSLLLVCLASSMLSGQRPAVTRNRPTSDSQLLNADEGLAIIGAALQTRLRQVAKPDCSHLVHAVYERAGFPYPYMRSADLYAGVPEFRRVMRPQPGDLIVWPGHVGIAISPAGHSFFGELHTGLGVDKYDAPYWKERGQVRFYRYLKPSAAAVAAASPRTARLMPTTRGNSDPHESSAGADPEKEKAQSALAQPEVKAIPRVAVVRSERPRADEILQALSQAFDDTGATLHGDDAWVRSQPLIVLDGLEVERAYIDRDQGWADLKLKRPLLVIGDKVKHGDRIERQRWLLHRRDGNSWEVSLPQGAVCVPRDAVIRAVAHQLAALTDNRQTSLREKTQLARLLSALLVEQ